MKESRKWKDGVELFLDNRQIFLLFFSSAVVLSLVFALGVVVGKRTTDRPAAKPATDPLALLDQMGGEDKLDENLTFNEALSPKEKGGENADARLEPKEDEASGKPVQKAPPSHREEPKKRTASRKSTEKPERQARSKRQEDKRKRAESGQLEAKVAKNKPQRASAKTEVAGAEKETSGQGEYSLQLSSFQEKREAELFMAKLREGGMKPFMILAKIPGRGVWYRVRLGSYRSWDEALQAKKTFEREQKIIAYVARTE
jgi:cell division protein FtsN